MLLHTSESVFKQTWSRAWARLRRIKGLVVLIKKSLILEAVSEPRQEYIDVEIHPELYVYSYYMYLYEW